MIVYQTGDVLEGYRLDERIGAGGMGVVWRATQLSPERQVALELILVGHDNPAMRQLFEKEAALSARLSHPNIVPVIGTGASPEASSTCRRSW